MILSSCICTFAYLQTKLCNNNDKTEFHNYFLQSEKNVLGNSRLGLSFLETKQTHVRVTIVLPFQVSTKTYLSTNLSLSIHL